MRKKTIILVAATLSLAVACKKSKTSTPDQVLPLGMTAKINGVAWTASNVSYVSTYGSGTNYIDVSGYDTSGKTIDLRINNFTARGTFSIPKPNDSAFYATDFGALASPLVASSGTIVIEAVNDSAVGGTFSFTAGSITVTDGVFYTNYK